MCRMQLQRKQEVLLLGETPVHGTFSLTVFLSSSSPPPAVLLHGIQTTSLPFSRNVLHIQRPLFQFSSSLD